MSTLEELIQKLCPNGVEYRPLGEVCKIIRGKGLCKDDIGNGNIPIILYGELYTSYGNYITQIKSSTDIEKVNNSPMIEFTDILLPISSTTKEAKIGKASAYTLNNKAYLGSDAILLKHHQNCGFLVHLLNGSWFEKLKMQCVSGTTINHLNPSKLSKIKIPIPPIEVQEEIVRILDKFTELSAELTAELTARKKQYEFYRDNILNFSNDVPRYKLAEIFNTRNGYTPSKNNKQFWNTSEISWFRMEDIRENGRILDKAIQGVSISAVKGKAFPKNSIIISTSATIGEHALIKCESLANQRFTYLILKDEYKDKYNIMFLFYYCFVLDEYCKENLNQGNFASVDMRKFNEFEFPMPSLEEQDHIVAILDRFDKLCNDISEGLPAEIEARQKQYEYYRDKLLNFKEIAQ